MRLYTFQHKDSWAAAQQRGYLAGSAPHALPNLPENAEWPAIARAYAFMMAEMTKRVPGYGGGWPVWAWAVLQNPHDKDLIWVDESHVLIEVEVPDDRCLISSFDLYHALLNNWYLAYTEAESDARHRHGTPPTQAEVEASWQRIFDLDYTDPACIAWWGKPGKDDWQVCVERVYLHEVVNVTPCT